MHLTITYLTNRLDPLIKMFFDSLHRETNGNYTDIKLIVIDFHADAPGRRTAFAALAHTPLTHVPPKPTVWQGPHRLTRQDYFAASNARNTALCLAPDGWIAYVDDLSVLMPGWLACIREAMAANYIVLGAYKKVLNLTITPDGSPFYSDFPPGIDSRSLKLGQTRQPVTVAGSWLFGCSLALPVEALLTINGWDEDCDSLGGEDYICGIMLERAGYRFRYDPRMLTLESEEAHHQGTQFVRFDKGVSPKDKSHAMLNMVATGRSRAPNYFGLDGIRPVRAHVLAGEPFPIPGIPEHDWYDGQPLQEI